MNSILKLIYLIILTSIPLFAQWRWINPSPQGNHLKDVIALGDGKSISVGNLGTIIKSENYGVNNTIIENVYTHNLTKITRVSDDKLVTVGQDGIILLSINDGNNWQKINSPFIGTFWDVCFPNSSVGFIIAYEGKILKTDNGGFNWNQVLNPVVSNFYSISMINENIGFISGNNGLIIKTSDGGNSWAPLTKVASTNILKVSAIDENIIFCGGQNDTVYKSSDGGISWHSIFTSNNLRIKDIQFLSPEIGFILGIHDAYRTSNGTYFTRILQTVSYENLTSINHKDSANSVIVGERGIMLKSTNNGLAWMYISKNIFTTEYTTPICIKFFDQNNGIIINSSGSVFRTTDAGSHFTQISTNINYAVDADFLNNNFGIAVGSSGRIYKTTNSGFNWSDCSISGMYINFRGVKILDEDTAVAVADYDQNSGIFRSTSKGNYWSIVQTQYPGPLNDISFWNTTSGMAVGEDGLLLKTTDAGQSWNKITFLNNRNIDKVECKGQDTIYLLVSWANIYKSIDGGSTFFILPFQITGGIYQIHFLNSSFGIASGPNGKVYKTINGGDSWSDVSCNTYDLIDVLEAISPDQFVAGSWNGDLLYYGSNPLHTEDQRQQLLEGYLLSQNYPNPFNPKTTIEYEVPEKSFVTIKIYDILGREVQTLVNNQEQVRFKYKVIFDASSLASGVYFYRMQAGSYIDTKKMMVLK